MSPPPPPRNGVMSTIGTTMRSLQIRMPIAPDRVARPAFRSPACESRSPCAERDEMPRKTATGRRSPSARPRPCRAERQGLQRSPVREKCGRARAPRREPIPTVKAEMTPTSARLDVRDAIDDPIQTATQHA